MIVLSTPDKYNGSAMFGRVSGVEDSIYRSVSTAAETPQGNRVRKIGCFFGSATSFRDVVRRSDFLRCTYCGNYCCNAPTTPTLTTMGGNGVYFLVVRQGNTRGIVGGCPSTISIFLVPPSVGALRHELGGHGARDRRTVGGHLGVTRRRVRCTSAFGCIVIGGGLRGTIRRLGNVLSGRLRGHGGWCGLLGWPLGRVGLYLAPVLGGCLGVTTTSAILLSTLPGRRNGSRAARLGAVFYLVGGQFRLLLAEFVARGVLLLDQVGLGPAEGWEREGGGGPRTGEGLGQLLELLPERVGGFLPGQEVATPEGGRSLGYGNYN